MKCNICNNKCQKWGRQKNGTQRYYCDNYYANVVIEAN